MLIDVERSVRCSCRRPPPGDETESYDIFFSKDGGCTLGIVFERESRDKWGSSNVPVVVASRVDATWRACGVGGTRSDIVNFGWLAPREGGDGTRLLTAAAVQLIFDGALDDKFVFDCFFNRLIGVFELIFFQCFKKRVMCVFVEFLFLLLSFRVFVWLWLQHLWQQLVELQNLLFLYIGKNWFKFSNFFFHEYKYNNKPNKISSEPPGIADARTSRYILSTTFPRPSLTFLFQTKIGFYFKKNIYINILQLQLKNRRKFAMLHEHKTQKFSKLALKQIEKIIIIINKFLCFYSTIK